MIRSVFFSFLLLLVTACSSTDPVRENGAAQNALNETNTTIGSELNSTVIDLNSTVPLENNETIEIVEPLPDTNSSELNVIDTNTTESNTTEVITDPYASMGETLKAYYSGALDKNGSALKSALHEIVSVAHFVTYSEAWEYLKETDKDINTIDEERIILLYKQISYDASDQCIYGTQRGCWNREHMWPKSLGAGYDDAVASYTDLHHLRPADAQINSDRSNKMYTEATTPYSKITGYYSDDERWEPTDELKGDIARTMFYMVVRYEGDNGEPDLELYKEDFSGARPAELCEMVAWHQLDPVSDRESRRNTQVERYQQNRNPFIDYPDWVEQIWGETCSD